MTVQKLIDKLQQIEDKSLRVVIYDMKYGFCPIKAVRILKAPELLNEHQYDDDVKYIDSVLIG